MTSSVEIAGAPSRVLAAIMDYIVLTAAFVLAVRLVPHPDYAFVASFVTGLIYFSILHSALAKGQSLGKRVFGLRVVSTRATQTWLTPLEAAFRYCNYLGWVILFTEVPPLYFRAQGIVASPSALDGHMLVVMMYFLANVSAMLSDYRHRALHDYFSSSIVVRGGEVPDKAAVESLVRGLPEAEAAAKMRRRFVIGLGCAAACGFWYFGLSANPRISAMSSHRYELEHRFPVRLVSMTLGTDMLALDLLYLDPGGGDAKQASAEIGKYLQDRGVFSDEKLKKVRLSLYSNPADSGTGGPLKRNFDLELPSLNVTEIVDAPEGPFT